MFNHGMSILSSKRILLGVTGSIAAYKAADLASKLTHGQVDSLFTVTALTAVYPLILAPAMDGIGSRRDLHHFGDAQCVNSPRCDTP